MLFAGSACSSRLEPKNLNLKLFLDSTIHGGKRGIWTLEENRAHKVSSLQDKSLRCNRWAMGTDGVIVVLLL